MENRFPSEPVPDNRASTKPGALQTAVGYLSKAKAFASTVVGAEAEAGPSGVAFGRGAISAGTGVALGVSASQTALLSVAVGQAASCNFQRSVAIGQAATASSVDAVAVGNAAAAAFRAIALGGGATATQEGSIALGQGVTTNTSYQVRVGPRHFELEELPADPVAPGANNARVYTRDNGAGKTQLCVRFPTGAVVVLATEP